jgi:hypothetical protein
MSFLFRRRTDNDREIAVLEFWSARVNARGVAPFRGRQDFERLGAAVVVIA